MKRGWVLVLIGLNLVALLALVFVYPNLMVSPGPLVQAHGELAADCFACHSPWHGAAATRCIECHVVADIGLRTTKSVTLSNRSFKRSFHQELTEEDCMACHSDHQGLVPATRNRKAFSHRLLRLAVRDQCESCHQSPPDSLHHRITGNCLQCHTLEGWKPATFDHAKLFVLDRDHDVDCVTCHVENDYGRYTCYGCHEHRPDKVREEHAEEGITDFENCVECHRSADEEPRQTGAQQRRERD